MIIWKRKVMRVKPRIKEHIERLKERGLNRKCCRCIALNQKNKKSCKDKCLY